MSGYWEAPNDYSMEPVLVFGSLHSISSEKIEKEKIIEAPGTEPVIPRRIGFLP